MPNDKILVAKFHCDGCGEDFDIFGTDAEKEKDGTYFCVYCGKTGKQVYSYDDYYVRKVK